MNRLQLLLCKLAEEASEVAQIALKTQQFGFRERHPDLDVNNAQRIHAELDDLFGVVQILNDEFGLMYLPDIVKQKEKLVKINRYAGYSQKLGMLHE